MMHELKLSAEQEQRLPQWERDRERRALDGRRLWRCWHCEQLAPWGKSWGCYASYREMDEQVPYPVFCSDECRDKLANRGVIPKRKAAA